jgi:hypothetical protein
MKIDNMLAERRYNHSMNDDQSAILAEAQLIVRDSARRLFVLADGARFDDLPGALAAAGIAHRSLYRNVQDAELVRAGPWLIDPYRQPDPGLNAWGGMPLETVGDSAGESEVAADTRAALQGPQGGTSYASDMSAADPERQLAAVDQLIGDAPAAIFWIGDATLTEASLWRHLRTLNMVLIPKEYDAEEDEPVLAGHDTHEAMMFRHGDGNVLAEVLPVLDAAQFSRVFGPAKALMFHAPDHPGPGGSPIRRAVLPDDAPPAQAGMLNLSMEQMGGIEDIRLEQSRRETISFLRENAAEETAHLSNAQLHQQVLEIEERGFDLGFVSSTAHLLYAFMSVTGSAEVIEGDEFANYVERTGMDPDDAISGVFDGMISAAEADARGSA